jgi:hypothetical protein
VRPHEPTAHHQGVNLSCHTTAAGPPAWGCRSSPAAPRSGTHPAGSQTVCALVVAQGGAAAARSGSSWGVLSYTYKNMGTAAHRPRSLPRSPRSAGLSCSSRQTQRRCSSWRRPPGLPCTRGQRQMQARLSFVGMQGRRQPFRLGGRSSARRARLRAPHFPSSLERCRLLPLLQSACQAGLERPAAARGRPSRVY